MDQLQDISKKIFELIDSAPEKTILGVRLGSLIKYSIPHFHPNHYGCRNLRDFIRVNVPAVLEKGRSGLDVIYTAGKPTAMPTDPALVVSELPIPDFVPLPTSEYDWKAYSNPSYPLALTANRDTGELQSVPHDEAVTPPWALIPKPSGDFHKEVANEFVATLQEPARSSLKQVLSDPRWYRQFSAVAEKCGVRTQWAAFRRVKLIAKFNVALKELGIPTTHGLNRNPSAPRDQPPYDTAVFSRAMPLREEISLRNLVQRVIAELPAGELRLLRLPVGVVFDVMRR